MFSAVPALNKLWPHRITELRRPTGSVRISGIRVRTTDLNQEAHRNAGNFRESKYFQDPNPWMIFSRVESLCTTHSILKNI
jgi:hypothetical protein